MVHIALNLSDLNNSDSRVVRASAPGAIDSALIPSRVKPTTSKLVFTAFLFDAQHQRESVEQRCQLVLQSINLFWLIFMFLMIAPSL